MRTFQIFARLALVGLSVSLGLVGLLYTAITGGIIGIMAGDMNLLFIAPLIWGGTFIFFVPLYILNKKAKVSRKEVVSAVKRQYLPKASTP